MLSGAATAAFATAIFFFFLLSSGVRVRVRLGFVALTIAHSII